jgi:hypothetical protein
VEIDLAIEFFESKEKHSTYDNLSCKIARENFPWLEFICKALYADDISNEVQVHRYCENSMVRCNRCDTENRDTNTYCEQCGSFLGNYRPDTPPRMEYTPVLEYSSASYSGNDFSSQPFNFQKVSDIHQRITAFRVIRVILYFIAALISAFGLIVSFVAFGSSVRVGALAFFFGFGLLVSSVVIFMRTRHRIQRLKWSQCIWWLLGATVGLIMAILLYFVFFPDASHEPEAIFFFGWIILLYGLVLAGVALW